MKMFFVLSLLMTTLSFAGESFSDFETVTKKVENGVEVTTIDFEWKNGAHKKASAKQTGIISAINLLFSEGLIDETEKEEMVASATVEFFSTNCYEWKADIQERYSDHYIAKIRCEATGSKEARSRMNCYDQQSPGPACPIETYYVTNVDGYKGQVVLIQAVK